MAARALLLLMLPLCSTLHVLPGLGRATPGKECSERCTFDATSQLAVEPKHFIHAVINETRDLGLVSMPRKEATLYLTKAAIESCVPGAVVETGVFTGGSSIAIMRALLNMDRCNRQYWAFDSFQGFPAPQEEDIVGGLNVGQAGGYAATQEVFESNMRFYHAWDDERVHVTKGWFNESIPTVAASIGPIAFLRLDGDLYASTMDVLQLLYDKVSPGGLVYFDDYGSFNGCRKAIMDFCKDRDISAPINFIREYPGEGVEAVWWLKE